MTKPLPPAPADEYQTAHTLFRALFFAAILVVGGAILGTVGWRADLLIMSWLHL